MCQRLRLLAFSIFKSYCSCKILESIGASLAAFSLASVTKATPIQFIYGRSHMKKRRCRKTAFSSYYACFSRDLLLILSGADTHIHQRSRTKRFQETRRTWPSAVHTWFKNYYKTDLIKSSMSAKFNNEFYSCPIHSYIRTPVSVY